MPFFSFSLKAFGRNESFWLLIYLISFFFIPRISPQASAHVGKGPPFVQINNQYCPTNPYYAVIGGAIPQDVAPEMYRQHSLLHFTVDKNRLKTAITITDAFQYRWTFITADNSTYAYGSDVAYTFSKTGTAIVVLEVRDPLLQNDTQYTLIDTIQLHILPFIGYHVPDVHISVGTQNYKNTNPIHFMSQTMFDPSTKRKTLIWYFGDGGQSNEESPLHTYTNFTNGLTSYPVILSVFDTNGLVGQKALLVQSLNGTLSFLPIGTTTKIQSRPSLNDPSRTFSPFQLSPILFLVVLALILSFIIYSVKLRKN